MLFVIIGKTFDFYFLKIPSYNLETVLFSRISRLLETMRL